MTTQEILTRIRSKVLEATTEIVPDANILQDINFSNDEVVKRTFTNASVTSTTVTFTAGEATLPTNFGTAYGDAIYNTTYFKELNIGDFDKQTQSYSFTIENGKIKVFPTDTATFTLKYWPKVTTLSIGVDPTVDTMFHECILYGALYRTLQDLQDEELSNYYKQLYDSKMTEKLSIISNYEEGNQQSGEMFTAQTLI